MVANSEAKWMQAVEAKQPQTLTELIATNGAEIPTDMIGKTLLAIIHENSSLEAIIAKPELLLSSKAAKTLVVKSYATGSADWNESMKAVQAETERNFELFQAALTAPNAPANHVDGTYRNSIAQALAMHNDNRWLAAFIARFPNGEIKFGNKNVSYMSNAKTKTPLEFAADAGLTKNAELILAYVDNALTYNSMNDKLKQNASGLSRAPAGEILYDSRNEKMKETAKLQRPAGVKRVGGSDLTNK